MDYFSIPMGTQKTGNRACGRGLSIPREDAQGRIYPFSVTSSTNTSPLLDC